MNQYSLTKPHTNTQAIKQETVSRSLIQTHGQSNINQYSLTQPHTNTRAIKHETIRSHAASSYKHTGNQTENKTVSRSLIQTHGQSNTKQYSLTQPRIDSDSPSCQSVTDTLFPPRPLSLTFPRFRHFQPP